MNSPSVYQEQNVIFFSGDCNQLFLLLLLHTSYCDEQGMMGNVIQIERRLMEQLFMSFRITH